MKDIEKLILYKKDSSCHKSMREFLNELLSMNYDTDISVYMIIPYGTRNRHSIYISDSDNEEEIIHTFYIKDDIDSIEEFKERFNCLVNKIKRSLMIDKILDI